MSTQGRDRDRRAARRREPLDEKTIILIVCEGRKTEPSYFKGLAADCRNPRLTIEIPKDHGVPMTLVNIAKKHKRELNYNSVWCVFDVDEHPDIPAARKMAERDGIKLAISNPCFELWLLLHFTEPPGLVDRTEIKRRLKGFLPEYDKTVEYGKFKHGLEDAIKRAEYLEKRAADSGAPGCNPTTGVHKLVEVARKN